MSAQQLPGVGGKLRKSLIIGALGVVFGDIGTSPLYAVKECFLHQHGIPGREAILGILSLILWLIIIVVGVKYIAFVMLADRKGEGGVLSLMQMLLDGKGGGTKRKGVWLGVVPLLGVFGAALLYGDGTITPAISVLSAVEGLTVVTDVFQPAVIPVTIAILIGLFSIQKHGTERVGGLFGPVTLVWFLAIAATGISWLVRAPEVLLAIDPRYGLNYLFADGWGGLKILGAVVLAVTGAEALYADMGHFGRSPIRQAWFAIVMPSLLLNYLGQGAFLLASPGAENAANPFFRMVPSWGLIPMVVIATLATIVASQALISGAFSMTMQAMQMGFFPRLAIHHTSPHTHGQIYIPFVNWCLMLACIGLVIEFKDSGSLAGAYSIAVVLVMAITSILFYRVTRDIWKWPLWLSGSIITLFLGVDLVLIAGNLPKVLAGGYFTLGLALAITVIMTTWATGRFLLGQKLAAGSLGQEELIQMITSGSSGILRVKGTAVYMSASAGRVPVALLHNLKHNKVLHERVIFLTVNMVSAPYVRTKDIARVEQLECGFWRVTGQYGYMQTPSVPKLLNLCSSCGLEVDSMKTTYFLGRESLLTGKSRKFAFWRQQLFAVMCRLAQQPARYFAIPPGRVIELGLQVDLGDPTSAKH